MIVIMFIANVIYTLLMFTVFPTIFFKLVWSKQYPTWAAAFFDSTAISMGITAVTVRIVDHFFGNPFG